MRASGAWLHVDGAFGLWAAASPAYRAPVAVSSARDSWATDGHKRRNVPYDCGLAIVADRAAHRRAMSVAAAYLVAGSERDNLRPHARGLAPRPRLPALRGAALARPPRAGRADPAQTARRRARFASILEASGAEILNDVVLNQVLVAAPPGAVAQIEADGTRPVGGTVWRGREAIRISVSSWATTDSDVERSARPFSARSTARSTS